MGMDVQDMESTGRRYPGPGEELLEVLASDGSLHTLLAYKEDLREDGRLARACEKAARLHGNSRIRGLVPFTLAGPGMLVFDTGPCWSAAEFVELMRHRGQPAGVRAGLELLGDGVRVLVAAANAGARHGIFRHGAVSPWRVFLSAQGDALIMGYGLPHAGMLDQMRVELLRYTPPERLSGEPEALPTDLFGMALVAFEVMTGEPFFGEWSQDAIGDHDIRRRLDVLPDKAADVLYGCLRIRPDYRCGGGEVLLNVQSALGDTMVHGPRLKQLAAELGQQRVQDSDPEPVEEVAPHEAQVVDAEPVWEEPPQEGAGAETVEGSAPDTALRPPDPVPPGPGGAPRTTSIQLGEGGRRVTLELTARMSLAEAVSTIIGTAVPQPQGLDGRSTHAWRIGNRTGPLSGTLTLDSFPPGEVLFLYGVPTRALTLQIKVGRDLRSVTVANTLQVSSLNYALCREHGLPPSPWRLTVEGRLVSPHLLVDELSEHVEYELQPVW